MEYFIFKFIGVVGMVFLIFGLLLKNKDRKKRDWFYVFGGMFLLIYSIYINDLIFIILQIVFVVVAGFDILRRKNEI